MKLIEFTVKNFRSISEGHHLKIDKNFTVLIGKNNEGKSNLLRALALAYKILTNYASSTNDRDFLQRIFNYPRYRTRKSEYIAIDAFDWDRDYPISKQHQKNQRVSLRLDFELTEDEQRKFHEEIGKTINHKLPISIAFTRDEIELKIPKNAYGKTAIGYDKKIKEIANFVCSLFQFIYIPAIRPADYSMNIINNLIRKEFFLQSEKDEEYKKAQRIVASFTDNILKDISKKIKTQIQDFIDVKNVSVEAEHEVNNMLFIPNRYTLSDYDIKIDDGCETSLYEKGDGLKSITALSLVKALNNRGEVFLAIEEPESHLHPSAIKKIKNILEDISSKNQVIISTHSPLLVNRQNLRNNLIVTNKKVRCVTKISEIRNELGVEISDNLINAEFILLVEGESDKIALKALLAHYSDVLKRAFDNDRLVIDTLGGAANLSYKASLYTNNDICKVYACIDNDESGKKAIQKARDKNFIASNGYTLIAVQGYKQSEIEDMYEDSLYKEMLKNNYSLEIPANFWKDKNKWSDKIKNLFNRSGKLFDEKVENKLKMDIAELVENNTDKVLSEHRRNCFDELKKNLEELIKSKNND